MHRTLALEGLVLLRFVPRDPQLKTAFYARLQAYLARCQREGLDPWSLYAMRIKQEEEEKKADLIAGEADAG